MNKIPRKRKPSKVLKKPSLVKSKTYKKNKR
jgi:hypothetical protein